VDGISEKHTVARRKKSRQLIGGERKKKTKSKQTRLDVQNNSKALESSKKEKVR
jgi:hypothetical protein